MAKNPRFTQRFAMHVGALCREMTNNAVAEAGHIHDSTVKDLDTIYVQKQVARADIFIVLDNVQFPKTGGTWINRVRLSIGGSPDWVSIPVVRAYHRLRLISEMKINNEIPWRKKLLRSIEHSYGRAPYFHGVFPFLTELIENPIDHLVEFNLKAVRTLAATVGLAKAEMVLSSTLDVHGHATDLLVAMVRAIGGAT